MSDCAWNERVAQAIRAGQWPEGVSAELREHIAGCSRCAEDARVRHAFAVSRAGAMRGAALQSPELLWWKAQLRRRRDAMERLERPGFAVSLATIAVTVGLLVLAWKSVEWSQLLGTFGAEAWMVVALGAVLCGFAVVAVLVGVPERRV